MSQFIKDFFKRIQYQGNHQVEFEDLPQIMYSFAMNVPFENKSIIVKEDLEINVQNLRKKIIHQQRGGLCYELNPLFYYFLQEVGFDVQLVTATVSGNDPELINTHIAILIIKDNEKYLIDVGFGSYLALQPIPFTGEFITSVTGKYRINHKKTERGDYILEKYRDGKLEASYSFFLDPVDELHLYHVKDVITNHPQSKFNKSLFLTKITEDGHATLTTNTYTVMIKGRKTKQNIDSNRFKQLSESQYGIATEMEC